MKKACKNQLRRHFRRNFQNIMKLEDIAHD